MTDTATLTIAGNAYPIRFPMAALTRILQTLKVDTQDIAEKFSTKNLNDIMEFTLAVSWSGLVSGAKQQGKPVPFKTPEDLGESVETLDELSPAVEMFTAAWMAFTGADEANERPADEQPGEVQPAPEVVPAAEG